MNMIVRMEGEIIMSNTKKLKYANVLHTIAAICTISSIILNFTGKAPTMSHFMAMVAIICLCATSQIKDAIIQDMIRRQEKLDAYSIDLC